MDWRGSCLWTLHYFSCPCTVVKCVSLHQWYLHLHPVQFYSRGAAQQNMLEPQKKYMEKKKSCLWKATNFPASRAVTLSPTFLWPSLWSITPEVAAPHLSAAHHHFHPSCPSAVSLTGSFEAPLPDTPPAHHPTLGQRSASPCPHSWQSPPASAWLSPHLCLVSETESRKVPNIHQRRQISFEVCFCLLLYCADSVFDTRLRSHLAQITAAGHCD